MKVSPQVLHTLYSVPFNLSCTAWSVVLERTVPLDITIEWLRIIQDKPTTEYGCSGIGIKSNVPNNSYITSSDGSHSILTVNETDLEHIILYRCLVKVKSDIDEENPIQKYREALIKVSGINSQLFYSICKNFSLQDLVHQ